MSAKQGVGYFLLVVASFMMLGTAVAVLNGNFSALTPGWTEFASNNPTFFAFVAVLIVVVFPSGGYAILNNM